MDGGLTVDGKGTLNLTAGSQGSGIGSGAGGSIGNIKIKGGTFNITSARASGVGAGWSGSVGKILFNGGIACDNLSFEGNSAVVSSRLCK